MGDALWLMRERLAIALRNDARALLNALRTRYLAGDAPYFNQAQATYPGGASELDAAPHLLNPREGDLEVGEVTILGDGAGKTTPSAPPAQPGVRQTYDLN